MTALSRVLGPTEFSTNTQVPGIPQSIHEKNVRIARFISTLALANAFIAVIQTPLEKNLEAIEKINKLIKTINLGSLDLDAEKLRYIAFFFPYVEKISLHG